ncbi:MAG: alpha-amylase family glycosyl hydrolase [Phototrophicaceae bacterium]
MTVLQLVSNTQPTFSPTLPDGQFLWWHHAIIYQIYPRSFQDTNGDGVGDLRGIQQRLPYLQSLGIDAIWITPFYRSPMADFGYDVADYCDIDPIFGTMADFDEMLATAHALGIRVLVDFVPNHSSDQHPWFIESRSSRDNPKRDWYIWRDGKGDGLPPNNWEAFFHGSAWTLDPTTDQYYLHLFLDEQPDLNWRNPELAQAMKQVLHFWLQKGVDGFRLDAITTMMKAADLPDMPPDDPRFQGGLLLRLVDVHNHPDLHPILREFRQIVDSYPNQPILVGETGCADFNELMDFGGREALDEIHLPMNLKTPWFAWDAQVLKQAFTDYYTALSKGAVPSLVLGNHDQGRLTSRYGVEHHRNANMLLLTLWGVPTLYYGDELGMPDGLILPEQRQDPFVGHDDYHGLGRDPGRTPMQWDATAYAGFSTVEPWLPVETTFLSNVAEQEQDPTSTLNFCKRLIELRRTSPSLHRGSVQFLDTTEPFLLAYQREFEGFRHLIIINFAETSCTLDLSNMTDRVELELSSRMDVPTYDTVSSIFIRPYESLLLKLG